MLVIGLTGGISSGKTTVARRFESHGIPIVDADIIAKELTRAGQPAQQRIVQVFGAGVLRSDGELDRPKLRELAFGDARKRVELEGILHPLIRAEMRARIQKLDTPYCVVVVPLLVETGQTDMVDRILVVDAPRHLQIARTMSRDGSTPEQIDAILEAQVDRQTRRSLADDVIINDQDEQRLFAHVDDLHSRYLRLATRMSESMAPPSMTESEGPRPAPAVVARVPPPTDAVIYELPINERVRTFLRLEGLFVEVHHHLQGDTLWDSRATIRCLVAIINIFARPDIKSELLKEMDRLNTVLNRYMQVRGVDTGQLGTLLRELSAITRELHTKEGQIGQRIRLHELISAIRQRDSIPGGAFNFDLPAYGHWLNKDISERRANIVEWLAEFELVKRAVALILQLIRNSADPTPEKATNGFCQRNLESSAHHQLVRVYLPPAAPYFPEISGGKHRFTVRFLTPNGSERPIQVEADVNFHLVCCTL